MNNVIEGCFGPKKTLRMKAVAYQRDLKATAHLGYEEKFAALLDLCDQAESGAFEVVIVAYPEILGDSEEELIRNLSLLSDTGLLLVVAQKSPRLIEAANVP